MDYIIHAVTESDMAEQLSLSLTYIIYYILYIYTIYIYIREGTLDRDRQRRDLCQDTRRRRRQFTSQREKPQKRPTCQHWELEVLASRTVGKHISVIEVPHLPARIGKPIQYSKRQKQCALFHLASKSSAF